MIRVFRQEDLKAFQNQSDQQIQRSPIVKPRRLPSGTLIDSIESQITQLSLLDRSQIFKDDQQVSKPEQINFQIENFLSDLSIGQKSQATYSPISYKTNQYYTTDASGGHNLSTSSSNGNQNTNTTIQKQSSIQQRRNKIEFKIPSPKLTRILNQYKQPKDQSRNRSLNRELINKSSQQLSSNNPMGQHLKYEHNSGNKVYKNLKKRNLSSQRFNVEGDQTRVGQPRHSQLVTDKQNFELGYPLNKRQRFN